MTGISFAALRAANVQRDEVAKVIRKLAALAVRDGDELAHQAAYMLTRLSVASQISPPVQDNPAPVLDVAHNAPVAWRVKDYADGWILFNTEDQAKQEASAMGCAQIEPLYTPTPPAQGVGAGLSGYGEYTPITIRSGTATPPVADHAGMVEQVREFQEWLNDRRNADVSLVFHELVSRFTAALSAPQPVERDAIGWAAVYDGEVKACHKSRKDCLDAASHYYAIHPIHLGQAWRRQED